MDWVDVALLVVANGIIDCIFVAWVAGIRSRDAMEKWLESEKANKTLDKIAERVEGRMEPRLKGFEERLDKPIQIDLAPIVGMVTDSLTPRVREEVDKVRAVIDGKIGFFSKVAKNTGEAVAEVVGEEAAVRAAGGDVAQAEILGEFEGLLSDEEWVKGHKLAAFGLKLLKRQAQTSGGVLQLQGGGAPSGGGALLRRRR